MYFIVSDTDSDEEREESSEVKPSSVSVLAAGAEMDEEWETYESDFMYYGDDLLYGDDPLEMERFEFSWVKKNSCVSVKPNS